METRQESLKASQTNPSIPEQPRTTWSNPTLGWACPTKSGEGAGRLSFYFTYLSLSLGMRGGIGRRSGVEREDDEGVGEEWGLSSFGILA